jgi:hypothetical protein
MDMTLQPGAVMRISRATFDPARFPEVSRMATDIAEYLVPAIKKLPGLIRYFSVLSPSGSYVHVSIWETDAYAQQMATLKEMIVDARRDADAVGVQFYPILNHAFNWTI